MSTILGTKYFPPVDTFKNKIFIWEHDNTQSFRIEKILTQFKYFGLFEQIQGMVIGKFKGIKRTAWEGFVEPKIKKIFMSAISEYKFSILSEVDFGHEDVVFPIPIGISAKMNSEKSILEFRESFLL